MSSGLGQECLGITRSLPVGLGTTSVRDETWLGPLAWRCLFQLSEFSLGPPYISMPLHLLLGPFGKEILTWEPLALIGL